MGFPCDPSRPSASSPTPPMLPRMIGSGFNTQSVCFGTYDYMAHGRSWDHIPQEAAQDRFLVISSRQHAAPALPSPRATCTAPHTHHHAHCARFARALRTLHARISPRTCLRHKRPYDLKRSHLPHAHAAYAHAPTAHHLWLTNIGVVRCFACSSAS